MESHKAGFPPFPLLLEIPSGLPHSHRFDGEFNISNQHRKGLVTDVSGPQRNVCPGTLTSDLGAVQRGLPSTCFPIVTVSGP